MALSVSVDLGTYSYPILISDHISFLQIIKLIKQKHILLVSNETVAPLYLQRWCDELKQNDFIIDTCVLPDGEEYKNWQTLQLIFDKLISKNYSRKTTLLALGGGVIGDMTGFAAATYQRGINLIQIPTTLLACVDSSVGGKTAINHPLGKNMIGSFYQPDAVIIETNSLVTLPKKEYISGLAEVIKYGCIVDYEFFCWLEQNIELLLNKDKSAIQYAIQRSCELKRDVVSADEKELTGLRAILNYGHTFAHAIEAVQKYKGLKHGEAVGLGMILAADLSCELNLISHSDKERIKLLIIKSGLPYKMPADVNIDLFWQAMRRDKKSHHGNINFTLLESIGRSKLMANISENTVTKVLSNYF